MIEAVKIDVIDLRTPATRQRIFVNQRKSRARDLFRVRRLQTFHDTFGQRGLASPEITDQQHDSASGKITGQTLAECDGLVLRAGPVGGPIAPSPRAGISGGRLQSGIFRRVLPLRAYPKGREDRLLRQLPVLVRGGT